MGERIREHAEHLDVLRVRLGRIGETVARFEQDQAAFGRLVGWVLTGLGERHVRHGELVEYVEETLALFVSGLHRVADGQQTLADLIGIPEDGGPQPEPESRSRPAAAIIEDVLETVELREWVEPALETAPVAEFALPVEDGFALLRSAGLDSVLDTVEPLRRMLDDLTGMPEVVAKQAGDWGAMAAELQRIGDDLERCLAGDLGDVDRADVRAYLAMMANNVEALRGLSAISSAMTMVTRAAGDLVLLTRDIVRGVIGDLAARTIVWSTQTTVVPLPVLAARLGSVVATAWRVDAYLKALVNSIVNLSRSIDG
ncbi:hypothetical protein [Actinoplanes couchii]|uniref:Uncharacterized protein n=1 Tax=Actinoplanes couchii TaxID=403638 RepID=A0ABQ3XHA8_9ACTN|nr:hypothetical protein [Actinoplanes couchii]MDR6320658.1 hypothetical protein [Actinoplanes couchii]GID57856.1 hypothetical protein Aco03nite_062600 [Actinoplanes couchii]